MDSYHEASLTKYQYFYQLIVKAASQIEILASDCKKLKIKLNFVHHMNLKVACEYDILGRKGVL